MIWLRTLDTYCKDFTHIENYDKAITDTTQTWECHHRLETHNSDGEKRLVDISKAELIALGAYYNRPPEELIFLSKAEHRRLHTNGMKGKHHSEETKMKISNANKGRHQSEETRKKKSDALKGKPTWAKGKKLGPLSEETKRKISETIKGKHWKLVDGKRVWY